MTLSQRALITNVKFIYKKEGEHLKGKLKYFQHRDDRDTHIQQRDEDGEPIRRWHDRGLGDNYGEISDKCHELATTNLKKNIGARTLVFSPQVEFMAAIPEDRRMDVMTELTDSTIEKWFESMEKPTPEFAFVVHKGEVKNERPEEISQDNKEFIHSHIVLAATTPGLFEERESYKIYKEQIQELHRVGQEEMERIWTRELGHERVVELNRDLEDLTQQLQNTDLERTQSVEPRPLKEVNEATIEIYNAVDVKPPDDLIQTILDARAEISDYNEISVEDTLQSLSSKFDLTLDDLKLNEPEHPDRSFILEDEVISLNEIGFSEDYTVDDIDLEDIDMDIPDIDFD